MRRVLAAAALVLLAAPVALAEAVFPPGSAIGLEPPEGFAPSATFSGFENAATRGSFVFLQAPAAAFAEAWAGLTTERLAGQGVVEEERRSFVVAGREGLLVRGRQALRGQAFAKWILLFPGEGLTGLITVNLPVHPPEPATRAAVERALGSVAVRTPDAAAERAALPFAFEEAPGLRLRRAVLGSVALLTPEGAVEGDATAPSLIIAASMDRQMVPGEARAVAERAMRALTHLRDLRVTAVETAELAGVAAVLLRADATDARSGALRRVAQWLAIFPEGGTLRAIAEAPPERFDAAWPAFERVVASVRRR